MRVVESDPPDEEPGDCPGLSKTHGCYKCCQACNVDMHRCPGCGVDINHGIGVCLKCRNRKD